MILVTGATGQVGSHLVTVLTTAGAQVRAVVQPGVQPPWPDGAVDVLVADFEDGPALHRAAAGAERVFMLVPPGPSQPAWQRSIVDVSRDAELVVKLSAFDSRADSPLQMGRWHAEGEQALLLSGIPHVILRPQYFMQNLLHDASALRAGVLRTFIPPGRPVGMVDAHDVAEVAAAVLLGPVGDQRVLVPTGARAVSTAEVAAAVADALGRPVSEEYLDPDQARRALLAAGREDWHADDTIEICQTASPQVTDCVATLLGRPARDITNVVRALMSDRTAAPAGAGRG